MIKDYFRRRENVETIVNQIQGSQFFKFYNDDVEYFYRDGIYRT